MAGVVAILRILFPLVLDLRIVTYARLDDRPAPPRFCVAANVKNARL